VLVLAATAARAQDTCTGLLTIEFLNPPAVVHVNDLLTRSS
jgi:hypothetical protein